MMKKGEKKKYSNDGTGKENEKMKENFH